MNAGNAPCTLDAGEKQREAPLLIKLTYCSIKLEPHG